MEKKKISPRIDDQSRVFLSNHFSTLNAGAEYVLDSFPMLFKRALHEMRGIFSDKELSFLVEAFKEPKLSSQLAGQQLRLFCNDAITFGKIDDKWEIEGEVFSKKIETRTSFQLACLEIWAKKFWYSKWGKGDKNLREYVAALL